MKHTKPKTVRFWLHWKESIVRLSLTEGQTITLNEGGPTDEGWSYRQETFTLEDGVIISTLHDSGADCDGRLDYFSRHFWAPGMDVTPCLGYGRDGALIELPECRPCWETEHAWQRDFAAQAAGY